MIVDLPDTTVSSISKMLIQLREERGAAALGRVLTLVIASAHAANEAAIAAANTASREHPMRVIVLSTVPGGQDRLDAQIRIGGDAGASDVIVLQAGGDTASDPESLVTGLLLSDAPVVVWWPGEAPEAPASAPLGRIAQRRITDAAAASDVDEALRRLARGYAPGDTDLAWTRLTLWRAQLAAVLDQPPYDPVRAIEVSGAANSPSTKLLAAWLRLQLRVPCQIVTTDPGTGLSGIRGVRLERDSGAIELFRDVADVATLIQPGQPRHEMVLPRRSDHDCLAEELRRLGPDELFGDVVRKEESVA